MPPIHYPTVGAVVLAFLIAAVTVRVARAVVYRLLGRLDMVSRENHEAVHARARQLTNALTLLAYGIAALASLSLALSRFGVGEPRWDPGEVGRWVATHGVNAIIIAIGAFVVVRASNLAIGHIQFKMGRDVESDLERQRRLATLGGILTRLITTAVGFVAALMLLRELSIDVMPILTGAGIVGRGAASGRVGAGGRHVDPRLQPGEVGIAAGQRAVCGRRNGREVDRATEIDTVLVERREIDEVQQRPVERDEFHLVRRITRVDVHDRADIAGLEPRRRNGRRRSPGRSRARAAPR